MSFLLISVLRSAETMVMINSWLLNQLGMQYLDTSPWALNHASLSPTDEAVLMARKENYLLYLTTNREFFKFSNFDPDEPSMLITCSQDVVGGRYTESPADCNAASPQHGACRPAG